MTYYCFLCNENHEDSATEEHFIPRSIGGPESQWLPVCNDKNARSNSVFDNDVRDILYMARFQKTKILKRSGEALSRDGALKRYKFSYDEPQALQSCDAFNYFFDLKSHEKILSFDIYAIKFAVGLNQKEITKFCRGLAKMSIGALAYLLKKEGIQTQNIKRLFSQKSIDAIRYFALKLPWTGNPISHKFSLGQTDVISRLQSSCQNPMVSNHVIEIKFQKNHTIHIEGMLYSKYGWRLNLSTDVFIDIIDLRLENAISDLSVPEDLRDMTLSPDSICIINPLFKGQKPNIPKDWSNSDY